MKHPFSDKNVAKKMIEDIGDPPVSVSGTMEIVVVAKCVGCGKKRDIRAGEVASGDVPMCDECFMPMVADKATTRKRVNAEEDNIMKMNKADLINALKLVRRTICSYGVPYGKRCDCKYGAFKLSEDTKRLPSGEQNCGCPEMYAAIAVIYELTDHEWHLIVRRLEKKQRSWAPLKE